MMSQNSAVRPDEHPPVTPPKVGVLLMNLGTPEATDYWSMRRYLSEFLSDKRVIEAPSWFWQPLLQGIILTVRPSRSGHAYAQIWNKERDESPLRTITRCQSEKLASRMAQDYPQVIVDWGWRYGTPPAGDRIQALFDQGCDRILLTALYPQYSATTTATAYDQCFRTLMKMRRQPAVRCSPAYHDHPLYIDALAKSLERRMEELDWNPEVILASFHGLPKENLTKGDPYYCHCAKTTRLLRERLGMDQDRLQMVFQSRFGPMEWLQPYCEPTVEALAQQGIKNMLVLTPGFSSDCVETLEEINIGVRNTFKDNGGENFDFVDCLNDSDDSIELIYQMVVNELQGWI